MLHPAAPAPTPDAKPVEAAKPAEAPKPAKPPTKKEKDAARKAYGDGEKAYQAGDYTAAYENFKKANEIIPSSQAVYWEAKSLEAQNKTDEAIATYEAFLASPGSASADKVDDAKKRLGDLKAKLVGEVTIESTPPATVCRGRDRPARRNADDTQASARGSQADGDRERLRAQGSANRREGWPEPASEQIALTALPKKSRRPRLPPPPPPPPACRLPRSRSAAWFRPT